MLYLHNHYDSVAVPNFILAYFYNYVLYSTGFSYSLENMNHCFGVEEQKRYNPEGKLTCAVNCH